MGSWSEQQENRKEIKEKDKLIKEKLAGLFFDLSKLVFTAMSLVGGVSLIVDEQQVK